MPMPWVGKPLPDTVKKSKVAAGDNYGIASRAKIGKLRGGTVGYIPVSKKKLKQPPTSIA